MHLADMRNICIENIAILVALALFDWCVASSWAGVLFAGLALGWCVLLGFCPAENRK